MGVATVDNPIERIAMARNASGTLEESQGPAAGKVQSMKVQSSSLDKVAASSTLFRSETTALAVPVLLYLLLEASE